MKDDVVCVLWDCEGIIFYVSFLWTTRLSIQNSSTFTKCIESSKRFIKSDLIDVMGSFCNMAMLVLTLPIWFPSLGLPPAGGNVIISFSPTFLQQGLHILFKSPAPPPLLLAVSFKFSTCYSCYPSSFIVSAGGIVITDFSPVYFQQGFGFWFLVILLTIQTLSWEVLPHPPHSPSMALSNFHPFQLLSNNIRRFIQYVEVRIWLYKFF